MALPILIDANIPIYAAGRPHPLKQPCVDVLNIVTLHPSAFATDAEVLQELIHRYVALGAWPLGRIVFHGFAGLMHGQVRGVDEADVLLAGNLADSYRGINARDLLHTAVMLRWSLDLIVSADRDFDQIPRIRRLDPAGVHVWRRRFNL